MAEAQYTVARVHNYPNRDGSRVTKKVVVTLPNLTPRQVAMELKKKTRFRDVPVDDLARDIEIVGDEGTLTPTEVMRIGSMTEKNVRVTDSLDY